MPDALPYRVKIIEPSTSGELQRHYNLRWNQPRGSEQDELEQIAAKLGAAHIVVDARESALRFYRKQDYEAEGPGHVLFNAIAHVRMRKKFHPVGADRKPIQQVYRVA